MVNVIDIMAAPCLEFGQSTGNTYEKEDLTMTTIRSNSFYTEFKLNDETHRANGPAIVWNYGGWSWWLHGKFHRYYGPVENNNTAAWWIHHRKIK
jgi:hypothetical protein